MKICVYGAGAIGGVLGVRLALAGHAVSLVARGPHLAAIRARGLTLLHGEERHTVRFAASENAADFGPQDAVIVALKAHSLTAAAQGIAPLLGEHTSVVTAINGVPWWFFHGWGGALDGRALKACDPDGRIAQAIAHERIIGGVVFLAADVPEPGVVRHNSGNRVLLGEPSQPASPRVDALAGALAGAGFDARASANIRRDIWLKLWGNVCYNPVSVLTGTDTRRMLDDPHLYALFVAMMREAAAVGNALGLDLSGSVEDRIAMTRKLGGIKTSMLQDAEAGRPIELDAIVASTIEVAQMVGVPTPFNDTVFGLVRVRAANLGLYPA